MQFTQFFLNSTKVYEDCEDIRLSKDSMKLDNWATNPCFMFITPLTKKSCEHVATFRGELHTCG